MSEKLRKFITTEDDGDSSFDDFHDAYEASPYDQYQNKTTNTNSKYHTTSTDNDNLEIHSTVSKNDSNGVPMNDQNMEDSSIVTKNSNNKKSTNESVSIQTFDTNSIIVPIPQIAPMENIDNNVNIEKQNDKNPTIVSIGKQVPIPPPGETLVIPPAATIAGGSASKIYIGDITKMNRKNNQSGKKFQDQKGIAQRSVLLCPRIYLYDHYTANEKMKSFKEEEGPWALAKVLQVPNHTKMIDTYKLQYHDVHTDMDGWVSELPKNEFVKKGLQEGVKRANKQNWRFKISTTKQSNTNKHPSNEQSSNKQSSNKQSSRVKRKRIQEVSTPATTTNNGTCLLSGILEEDYDGSEFVQIVDNDSDSYRDMDDVGDSLREEEEGAGKRSTNASPNFGGESTEINKSPPQADQSSDDDEDSECDVMDTAFAPIPENIEDRIQPDVSTKTSDEDEKDYLGDEWQWNNWEEHDIETEIEGPKEDDHYSGPHGLKNGVSKKFVTVVQCLFQTTAINRNFFVRICAESNRYARRIMRQRNTSLFLGHKWNNITVEEMIHFFGIMLRISLEPRKMGGYESYFTEQLSITASNGYSTSLRGYHAWAKDIMSLLRFKQIRSAFRSECDRYDPNDKCYQLRWIIRQFNFMAKKIFHLGPNASFDEGGIPMRSRFCPVRQYNKDKPAKYRVDFFILADSRDYFIYHLDVYQGKNKANIDIHPSVRHLPTTQKAVANAILKSQIANDLDGCRYLFMDNRYAAPQLLALMLTNYNIRAVGTCKANHKGFESEALQLPKDAARGDFKRLHDKRLGMVITRWKDSKKLQTVSTVMKHGTQVIQRRNGANIIDVTCPNDIVLYQQNMGGVDRGDQHRMIGAGFSNVAHFKKWYKKAFLGIADFCLLQAFTAWNLSVDQLYQNRRGNSDVKRRKLIKWQFYSVLAEELMMYVDDSGDDTTVAQSNTSIRRMMKGHVPAPYFSFDKSQITSRPLCMICSMDEMARAQVLKLPKKNQEIESCLEGQSIL